MRDEEREAGKGRDPIWGETTRMDMTTDTGATKEPNNSPSEHLPSEGGSAHALVPAHHRWRMSGTLSSGLDCAWSSRRLGATTPESGKLWRGGRDQALSLHLQEAGKASL